MHVSLNWLKEFVKIPENLSAKELASLLTVKTAEVDSVKEQSAEFDKMVIGEILELSKHPNADKLSVCKVNTGERTIQIICGGTNLKEKMLVAIALPGSKLRWHGQGDLITLEKTSLRGMESEGMICAGSEIGINDPEAKEERHILNLSKTKAKPGTSLAEALHLTDTILEFDNKSLTHRPDLWGHYGIAREIAALTNGKLKAIKTKVEIPSTGESVKVDVQEPNLCPRYCGLIIDNVTIAESPEWLKTRLQATDHGTHGNIVDVTNYIMAELGQPMHAFDKSEIKTSIVVRHAKPGEKITSLDGKPRDLTPEMLLIADHEKPLAIAGVIGGQHSGITEKTTSIILESANFNSSSIRKTSTKLQLRTDAVQRFEKAIDPNLAELAIKKAAELILKLCPTARISGPITDVKNFNATPTEIILDTDKAQTKIGVSLSQKEMKNILTKLEFKITAKTKTTLTVQVPTFRAAKDVKIEDDLIEEIARMYGYDQLPATLPTLPTTLPPENTERFKKHRARELLSYGFGFDEVNNYSFYSKNDLAKCLIPEEGHVKLLNYLSEDQTHLRTTLVPNILKNLQQNCKNYEEIRIYEIGRTYKEINQFFPLEEKKITGVIMQPKAKTTEASDKHFYEAKGIVESFFKKFSTGKISSTKGTKNTPYAHPVKSLSYLDHNAQTIATIFTLHPTVAKSHDLENYNITFFTINFTELLKLPAQERLYHPIPKFPNIQIDVSILIDKQTEIATLEKAIKQADQALISKTELLDIYQGAGIDTTKKATTFRITLQAPDRTLTDQEMTATQAKIFSNLEKAGGTIRGK